MAVVATHIRSNVCMYVCLCVGVFGRPCIPRGADQCGPGRRACVAVYAASELQLVCLPAGEAGRGRHRGRKEEAEARTSTRRVCLSCSRLFAQPDTEPVDIMAIEKTKLVRASLQFLCSVVH